MPPTKLEDYEVVGGVGVVEETHIIKSSSWVKIRRKCDGQVFMWKELNCDWLTLKGKQVLLSDIAQLQSFRQDYVLPCFELIENLSTASVFIISECCENGNMFSLLNRCRSSNTFLHGNFVWKILYQLLKALEAVHAHKKTYAALYHHLQPTNIFLDSKWNVKLSLIDVILDQYFGFQKSFSGTPYYVSPEQIKKTVLNEKSDVWSIGCLVYELCALVPPFIAANWAQLLTKIGRDNLQRIPSVYSDELQKIICEMLTLKDEQRPSVSRLLGNPVFLSFEKRAKKQESSSILDVHFQHKIKAAVEKEKSLMMRERNLNERQTEIEESERKLDLKMKYLQEQLQKAEVVVGYLNKNKPFSSAPDLFGPGEVGHLNDVIEMHPPQLPMKKKVHFKLEESRQFHQDKENPHVMQTNSDNEKSNEDLQWRLQRAQIRALQRNEEVQPRHMKTLHFPR